MLGVGGDEEHYAFPWQGDGCDEKTEEKDLKYHSLGHNGAMGKLNNIQIYLVCGGFIGGVRV